MHVHELTGHIRKSVLLLGFHSKTDETVSFAEAIFVQNNLGASDVLVARREELVEGKVVDLWGEITDPNGGVRLSWSQACRIVIELESHRRITVWDDFTTETVHHIYCLLVGVKIDEAIACWLTSELVRHYLNRLRNKPCQSNLSKNSHGINPNPQRGGSYCTSSFI